MSHDITSNPPGPAVDKSVGIIGVGAMGAALARRLLKRGVRPWVRDIRPEAMAALVSEGARPTRTCAELARHCDFVVVLVVTGEQIHEVLFGADGAAPHLRAASVTILSSTISPQDAEAFAARLAALQRQSLDAPISGGPARADAGTLSMMLAGQAPAIERAQDFLSLWTSHVFRVGERAGDGARFKLLNNALAAVNLVAGGEILALGERLGLDVRALFQVICASSGASWVVEDRMARALAGDFEPRAATKILAKDVSLFVEMARQAHYPAFMGSQALQMFQAALAHDLGEQDDAALLKLYRAVGGSETQGQ